MYIYSYSKPLCFSPVLLLHEMNALSFLKWNLTFCCFDYAFLLLLIAEIFIAPINLLHINACIRALDQISCCICSLLQEKGS